MKWLAVALGSVVGLSGCEVLEDAVDGDSSCHTRADCPGEEVCIPPVSDFPVCGIPCTPDRQCEAGTCGANEVCQDRIGVCCSAWERPSSACQPACPTRPCADDELCDSGQCRAKLCDALDYNCPTHFTCTGVGFGADDHGCSRSTCTVDGDCAGGHCIEGQCFAEAASCGVFQAVP